MIQLKCEIADNLVDLLEAEFYEMGLSPWSILQIKENDTFKLLGCFDNEVQAKEAWIHLNTLVNGLPKTYDLAEITNDWKDEYKKYLKPWNCENLHWVPEWMRSSYPLKQNDVAFYVDAGLAFGTGMHETTQLCAERLVEYKNHLANNFSDKKIIDAGCGSGILAISAKLLGFNNVLAFDIDPEAVKVAQENALSNNIQNLTIKLGGLQDSLEKTKADFLMANILANVLCDNAPTLLNALNPNAWLVLSGILYEEREKVQKTFESHLNQLGHKNFSLELRKKGEWTDVLIKL